MNLFKKNSWKSSYKQVFLFLALILVVNKSLQIVCSFPGQEFIGFLFKFYLVRFVFVKYCKFPPKLLVNVFSYFLHQPNFHQSLLNVPFVFINKEIQRVIMFIILFFPLYWKFFEPLQNLFKKLLIPVETRVNVMLTADLIGK